MAATPNYAAAPRVGVAAISTANTARDGSGTIGNVLTAGAAGSRVDVIVVHATATTTAGMVRLFLHDGTTARLWREVPIAAETPSGTVPARNVELFLEEPVLLPSGWSLRASTHNAEAFNVVAFGGDY